MLSFFVFKEEGTRNPDPECNRIRDHLLIDYRNGDDA